MGKKITVLLPELAHKIKRCGEMYGEFFSRSKNVTVSQLNVVFYLMQNQDHDVNQKELEQALQLRKSTISSILSTMEKNNMVIRVQSKEDARRNNIVLDQSILPPKEKMEAYFNEMEDLLRKDIPQEQLDVFFEVLEQMIKNVEEGVINA